jgi:hypothetical protein
MATQLEPALAAVEARMDEAERQAKGLLVRLKRARRMAAIGDISGVFSQLEQAPEAADRLARAFRTLDGSFSYDAEQAFASGSYVAELMAEAERQGVTIVERDGRLSAFPLVLKLDARTPGVRVGRKMVRGIRPSALVKSLKATQQTGRFNASAFLEQLWRACQLVPPGWRPKDGSDSPVVSLSQTHALLTLHPAAAADYPREEFVCDLLRLNRLPDTRTKGGWGFNLPASTGSKGTDRLTVYDERGAEHIFVGIRFLAPARTGGNLDGDRA